MKISVRQRPFAPTPDPRFVYREGSYAQVMSEVTEGLRRREELILVTGAPGTGKSTLCHDVLLLSRLDRSVFPSMVSDPWVSVEEIIGHILRDCGMPTAPGMTRHDLMNALRRFLGLLSSQGAHVLLILDEAQHLRPEVVEHLRLLSSGDNGGVPVLQILIVGQAEVEKLFESPQMDQRVARRCALKSLDADETKRYIQHRLRAAESVSGRAARPLMFGGAPADAATDRFTPSAVREITALSGGALRAIDMICDRSLELASQRDVAQVDRPLVREVARQMKIPARSLRRNASSAMVATALVAGLPPIAWFWVRQAPPAAHAEAVPAAQTAVADPFEVGTLNVVPAVSVEVGSFASETRAAAVASQLSDAGLPASARPDFSGSSHLVMIGPYITDEEARGAQSTAVAQGFGNARILHQQTLAPGSFDSRSGNGGFPRIVAITPGGKRTSLAIELVGPPSKVTTQRISASILEIEIGPVAGTIRQQDLTSNGAATLVDRVSLRSFVAPDGGRFVRARVSMTEASRSHVRMAGRRIYVDLSSNEPPTTDTISRQPAPVAPAASRLASTDRQPRDGDQYRQAVAKAAARFDEIQPFLLSAVAAPSPDVLRAVGATLAEVRGIIDGVKVPLSAGQDHALLLSGLAAASTAVQPDYGGDRTAKVREAMAAFQVVKAQSSGAGGGSELLVADGARRSK